MTYHTQPEQHEEDLPIIESRNTRRLRMKVMQWLLLKRTALGVAVLLLAGLAAVVFLYIYRQTWSRTPPTARYLSLIGVPTLVQGGVTLYGVRKALEQDGWTVYWLHPKNRARAWKTSKGELLLLPGSATVPREQKSQDRIQFTPEIVLQGELLYAPASYFQQLMGKRLRIDKASGRLQLRQ